MTHSQDVLCLNFTNLCLFRSIPRSSYVFSTIEMLSPLMVDVWHVLVEILVCLFQVLFISTAVLYTKTLSHSPPIYTLVYLFVAVHNKTQLAEITGRKKVQKRDKHSHPVQKLNWYCDKEHCRSFQTIKIMADRAFARSLKHFHEFSLQNYFQKWH